MPRAFRFVFALPRPAALVLPAVLVLPAAFGCSAKSNCETCEVPADKKELEAFLENGEYLEFAAESAVHDSAGPHFGGVRVFLNQELEESLLSGNEEHPVGAAAVKELYGDGDVVLGYSVMVKVREGSGGNTWYWYEKYEGKDYADGNGDSKCTDCHSRGTDHFLSTYPLE